MSHANSAPAAADREASLRRVVLAVNLLYAASFLVGITFLVGAIVAHMKRADAAGTIWESHLAYAIRTFWIFLGLVLLGILLWFVALGWLVWLFAGLWFLIRVVRAFLAFNDGVPIADPRRFF